MIKDVRRDDNTIFTMTLTFFMARNKENEIETIPINFVLPISKTPGNIKAPRAANGTQSRNLFNLGFLIWDILVTAGISLGTCVTIDIKMMDMKYLLILCTSNKYTKGTS